LGKGKFPNSWRQSTIIPLVKPNKEKFDPGSYRPISLTSSLCKVMERMINARLVWFLEQNKIITPFQCGFHKGRSTTDQLVRFETFVIEAFIQSQHCVVVLLDLEKAYDTTWRYGIMKDLSTTHNNNNYNIILK
jgi:Reverse transcriptase (RNA-dependent DNA polymerase)